MTDGRMGDGRTYMPYPHPISSSHSTPFLAIIPFLTLRLGTLATDRRRRDQMVVSDNSAVSSSGKAERSWKYGW